MNVEVFTRAEERANATIHGAGAVLGAVGLGLLIYQTVQLGRSGSTPAALIYGLALVLLFCFSTIYHASIRPRVKQVFLALDHCGIYLLIAGTYTPFCLLMPADQLWPMLILVWLLASVGIGIQMAAYFTGRRRAYERSAFVLYLALGWIPIALFGGSILAALAPWGLGLLIAGGVTFSIGVIFFLWKRLPYGHAVWHSFIVAGSGFHFFSIFYYVVPQAP